LSKKGQLQYFICYLLFRLTKIRTAPTKRCVHLW